MWGIITDTVRFIIGPRMRRRRRRRRGQWSSASSASRCADGGLQPCVVPL